MEGGASGENGAEKKAMSSIGVYTQQSQLLQHGRSGTKAAASAAKTAET